MKVMPLILDAVGNKDKLPDWITQDHIDKCTENVELQENWEPKVGDWYFCKDIYKILQINDLKSYYSEGDVLPLTSDHGKDSNGHWECDIYLPKPTEKK